jgi:hypothetical protein
MLYPSYQLPKGLAIRQPSTETSLFPRGEGSCGGFGLGLSSTGVGAAAAHTAAAQADAVGTVPALPAPAPQFAKPRPRGRFEHLSSRFSKVFLKILGLQGAARPESVD